MEELPSPHHASSEQDLPSAFAHMLQFSGLLEVQRLHDQILLVGERIENARDIPTLLVYLLNGCMLNPLLLSSGSSAT